MRSLMLALSSLLLMAHGHAQYYDERADDQPGQRVVTVGAGWRSFRPLGSNSARDSAVIRFDRVMPTVGFRSGPVDILFGYTRFTQQGGSRAAIYLGATFSSDFPVAGRSSALTLPVVIAGDFTKAEAEGPERQSFNIACVGLGTGLKYHTFVSRAELTAFTAGIAQYAAQGYGIGHGFSAVLLGDVSARFPQVRIGDGLCLGYRVRYQSWSMNEAMYNYRCVMHGMYVGIGF